MKPPSTIFVVDDDPGVLKALGHLLRASQFSVRIYESPELFLAQYEPSLPGCVICDLAMPGVDGLELQRKIKARGSLHPVIFLSGHDSVPGSVQALKEGAVDFLTKPVREDALLLAVRKAVADDAELRALRERFADLTDREREVLEHVAVGRLNKQIGLDLGVSERTIKFHRSNLIRKLGITSTVQIVRLVIATGIVPRAAVPAARGEGARPGVKIAEAKP